MLENQKTNSTNIKPLRCAIYTRKSHEEGLEQEFNSLDAQREAAESYIGSQRFQGWQILPARYDDGGFSGGNMERPALTKLLADIDAGKVDVIVVYRLDRLSRSLLDFMNMAEHFNDKGISFVSVTESFNTSDPTGRLFLGILITFAQYEREVIAERIRDKVAAAKRRGKYCGGVPILGYNIDRAAKKLVVNREEAKLVRYAFQRYQQLGSAKQLTKELNEQGYKTKSRVSKKGREHKGKKWNTGQTYRLLGNCTYVGEVSHKGTTYPGEHEAIIDRQTWDQTQAILKENTCDKTGVARKKMVSPLGGVIRCGHCDCAMGITYTRKGERLYTYYICEKDQKRAVSTCELKRIPAGDIEKIVVEQLSGVFRSPSLVSKTYLAARDFEHQEIERLQDQKKIIDKDIANVRQQALELMRPENSATNTDGKLTTINRQSVNLAKQLTNINNSLQNLCGETITEQGVATTLQTMDIFWENLFPLEQNRLIRLLVERVDIKTTGLDLRLKTSGMTNLITEVAGMTCNVKARRN